MITSMLSLALVMLFSVMLPGPDFALITKNTLLHSRRTGLISTLGLMSAMTIHISYCIFGIAILITQSILWFTIIKYIGAAYIIIMGLKTIYIPPINLSTKVQTNATPTKPISAFKAYQQGLFCNLLNPKATLFFLALFTLLVKSHTPISMQLIFSIEMILIAGAWFASLTFFLSHPNIMYYLQKVETYLPRVLGGFLCFFGIVLIFFY